jgi:hypothetical protein
LLRRIEFVIGMRRKEPLERISMHGAQEGLAEVGRKVLEGGKGGMVHFANCNNKFSNTETAVERLLDFT